MKLIDIMLEGLGIREYFKFLFLFVKNYKMIQNTYESFNKGNRKYSCVKILLALLNTIASTKVELENLEKRTLWLL